MQLPVMRLPSDVTGIKRQIKALGACVVGFIIVLAALQTQPIVAVILLFFMICAASKGRRGGLTACGTARWASRPDFLKRQMINATTGLILGRSVEGDLIRLTQICHVSIYAPTGVGKGVSCIIPFLLTCDESAVVIDIKGENYLKTAEARRRLGHEIRVLDPFNVVTESPDTLNPIDFIDKDSLFAMDDCFDLANTQVIRSAQDQNIHFLDQAEEYIGGITAFVLKYSPKERSLQAVRSLISNPAKLKKAIEIMCVSDAWEGMLMQKGYNLTHAKDKELASILTTINRFMRWLDSPAMLKCTRESSFDPHNLTKKKMTVYCVLPPKYLRSHAALMRMWVGTLMRAVLKNGTQETNLVHFVVDEASAILPMDVINDCLDKYRGYGIRLQLYFQSAGQLKPCFPDDEGQTATSNTTRIYFGVNDYGTADILSNSLGEATIAVDSGGVSEGENWNSGSGGPSEGGSITRSNNWDQRGRKLLKAEEILAMDKQIAVTLAPNMPPIMTRLIRYYEEPWLTGEKRVPERKKACGYLGKKPGRLRVAVALILIVAFLIYLVVNKESNWSGVPPNEGFWSMEEVNDGFGGTFRER